MASVGAHATTALPTSYRVLDDAAAVVAHKAVSADWAFWKFAQKRFPVA
jgi:hypothetical protein